MSRLHQRLLLLQHLLQLQRLLGRRSTTSLSGEQSPNIRTDDTVSVTSRPNMIGGTIGGITGGEGMDTGFTRIRLVDGIGDTDAEFRF